MSTPTSIAPDSSLGRASLRAAVPASNLFPRKNPSRATPPHGHGKKHLSTVFLFLRMLAVPVDQMELIAGSGFKRAPFKGLVEVAEGRTCRISEWNWGRRINRTKRSNKNRLSCRVYWKRLLSDQMLTTCTAIDRLLAVLPPLLPSSEILAPYLQILPWVFHLKSWI